MSASSWKPCAERDVIAAFQVAVLLRWIGFGNMALSVRISRAACVFRPTYVGGGTHRKLLCNRSRCNILVKNGKVYMKHNSLGDDMPIVVILRAMGAMSDQEIVQLVRGWFCSSRKL